MAEKLSTICFKDELTFKLCMIESKFFKERVRLNYLEKYALKTHQLILNSSLCVMSIFFEPFRFFKILYSDQMHFW